MAIGKGNKIGNIGKATKLHGGIGKNFTGTQGSSLVPDQSHCPVFYPSTTTTTSSSTTTTSSSSTTTSSSSTVSTTSTQSTTTTS